MRHTRKTHLRCGMSESPKWLPPQKVENHGQLAKEKNEHVVKKSTSFTKCLDDSTSARCSSTRVPPCALDSHGCCGQLQMQAAGWFGTHQTLDTCQRDMHQRHAAVAVIYRCIWKSGMMPSAVLEGDVGGDMS